MHHNNSRKHQCTLTGTHAITFEEFVRIYTVIIAAISNWTGRVEDIHLYTANPALEDIEPFKQVSMRFDITKSEFQRARYVHVKIISKTELERRFVELEINEQKTTCTFHSGELRDDVVEKFQSYSKLKEFTVNTDGVLTK